MVLLIPLLLDGNLVMNNKKSFKKTLKPFFLSILGVIFLYFFLAWCLAEFVADPHLPFQEPLFTEGAYNATKLATFLNTDPTYPPVKNAKAVIEKLTAIGIKDPALKEAIDSEIYPHRLDEYILDLTDFAPLETLHKPRLTKVRIKGCTTEKILYAYLPKTEVGRFVLCRDNHIYLNRYWEVL